MRSMKLLLAAAAAMGLSAAPAIAQTTSATPSASKLSVAKNVRAGTKSKGSNLAGAELVPVVLGALAIAGGVYLAVDGGGDDDDDNADSN